MSGLLRRLIDDFKDKVVRDVYCDEFLNAAIATQIKVLREQRGLTQVQLAELSGMKQSRIATMEDVNYSSWTLSTLRKLAKAFDVALTLRFESFGEKLREIDSFSRRTLERPSFAEDPITQVIEQNEIDMLSGVPTIAPSGVDIGYSSVPQIDGIEATFSARSESVDILPDESKESVFTGEAA
jgi:transcriptional regulator with XRE-family HTH domain